MADDVKGSNVIPVGESTKPITLAVGDVIDLPNMEPKKVPQGKKIINFVVSWTGLMVDE